MVFDLFRKRKPEQPERSKEDIRSWSVNVRDTTRSSPPYMWPLAAFAAKEEAQKSIVEFRTKYAGHENLTFDIYPSEREPEKVIPWFENFWGPRPPLPQPEDDK
jgi:hypothetical protein